MSKYISKYEGPEIDEAIEYILSQKETGTDRVIESSPDNIISLDNLKTEEGRFIIYYYDGAAEESEPGKPIEITVFKDKDGNIVQRYEKNGITMERKYDPDADTWTNWAPVTNFVFANKDEEVVVGKDTIVFREFNDASEVPTE